MNGSRETLARTTTRALLTVTWASGTLLALHAALTGAPDPFTGFVLLPAMVLGGAACAVAIEMACVRRVDKMLDALANGPGALRALVTAPVAGLVSGLVSGLAPAARRLPHRCTAALRAPAAPGASPRPVRARRSRCASARRHPRPASAPDSWKSVSTAPGTTASAARPRSESRPAPATSRCREAPPEPETGRASSDRDGHAAHDAESCTPVTLDGRGAA